jgi:putative ABC transport system ATP-binding protein
MEQMISLRGLVKNYMVGTQVVEALRGIDLVIKRGEYVAIMGPSGSGKSTLMNILGALDTPTSGHYFLNGTDVSQMVDDELRCHKEGPFWATAAMSDVRCYT